MKLNMLLLFTSMYSTFIVAQEYRTPNRYQIDYRMYIYDFNDQVNQISAIDSTNRSSQENIESPINAEIMETTGSLDLYFDPEIEDKNEASKFPTISGIGFSNNSILAATIIMSELDGHNYPQGTKDEGRIQTKALFRNTVGKTQQTELVAFQFPEQIMEEALDKLLPNGATIIENELYMKHWFFQNAQEITALKYSWRKLGDVNYHLKVPVFNETTGSTVLLMIDLIPNEKDIAIKKIKTN